MELVLQPYFALGPIQFGMRRDEVRQSVHAAVRTFRKASNVGPLVDSFDEEGIHVYYDAQDLCEAVEAASPASPSLNGRQLIGSSFAEMRDWLRAFDPDLEVDETGLTSFTLGLGLYAPSAQKAPDEPVEAAIAFRRGYYS